jgi:hypothetical protein
VHGCTVDLEIADEGVEITATVRTADRTGVEMEALTAVSVAALAIVDMVKALDKGTSIENVRLIAKTGGKSGDWVRRAPSSDRRDPAGGWPSRVGGADKTLFALAGTTLLQRAVDAVAGADPITVVGDPVSGVAGVAWARKTPHSADPPPPPSPHSRPGVKTPSGRTCSRAICPKPSPRHPASLTHAPAAPRDRRRVPVGGRQSPAVAHWPVPHGGSPPRCRRAAEQGQDASMRALLDDAAIAVIAAPDPETQDVDTWEDLSQARARLEETR